MKDQCHLILAQAGGAAPTPAAPAASAAPAAPAASTPPAPPAAADPLTAIEVRNTSIRGVFAQFRDIGGIAELEATCLADPRMSVEQAQSRLLARMGGQAAPLNDPAVVARVQLVTDETDRARNRIVAGLLARAGVLTGAEAAEARQGNPAATLSLLAIAEQSLLRAGIACRHMSRSEIAATVLAQSTSDFPVLLENALHKTLLAAYALAKFTWDRFCAKGTITDFRPHDRYHLSSFSDLKDVGEEGEYENGVLGDAAKERIQGKRKGRILQLTPEVLINDDLGGLVRLTQQLGQAAGRTIEKDVYALFALNSGAGPTMQDGKTLFHADHGNLVSAGGTAPTVAAVDAMRQLLAAQKDPGGNDFLDLALALFVGPTSLGGTARVVNEAQYDVDVSNKLQVPNKSRGLFREVIDSPRLSGTAWFGFADPSVEPVFEVAFLDGVQAPTIEQNKNFRTSGLEWKVEHRYAVGAVGWRGAVKNVGA